MRISAIIPAAGVGKRFQADVKKQFFTLKDKPILYYTLKCLARAYSFDEFVLGVSPEDHAEVKNILDDVGISNYTLSLGGNTRAETVLNALFAAKGEYVAVHDAVRPFVGRDIVTKTIETAMEYGAAICALPAVDTIKTVKDGVVTGTIDRDTVYMAHTPQVFQRVKLIKAIENAMQKGISLTDEASAFEHAGYGVKICVSDRDNIKLTAPEDLPFAEILVGRYFLGAGEMV